MADRYWVGGTGNWNDTARWSTSSGGGSGASVPTSIDNVYFDGSSDAGSPFTVTVNVQSFAKDLIIGDGTTVTVLDQTMTLAGTSQLDVYGSLFYPATNLTRTYSGKIRFFGTTTGKTITTNGVQLTSGSMSFQENGTWSLGSALTVGFVSQHVEGTFNLNGYNLTAQAYAFNNFSSSAIINCGSGTITFTESAAFNGGSSAIIINGDTSTINFVLNNGIQCANIINATFYNLNWTFTSITSLIISLGSNLVVNNNLTIASRAASGLGSLLLNRNITVGGTLTIQSSNTDPSRRFSIFSDTFGTPRTITAAAINFGAGIDCRDITAAGVAGTWDLSAKAGGDCGGNTNITFPVAKTVFRKGTGNWSATQWAATSAGAPATDQFPLAQDTAIFGADTTTGTHTIDFNWQIGALDMTNSTVVTLAAGTTTPTFYNDLTFSTNVTPTGTGLFTFAPKSGVTLDITTANKTLDNPITISANGTVKLTDNFTTGSSRTTTLTAGTFDLNNQTYTTGLFNSNNSNIRAIAFGTGNLTTTGSGTVWTTATTTNFSRTGTPTVNISNNSATATTVSTGTMTEAQSLNFNYTIGTYTLTDTSARYRSVNFTGFSGTIPNSARTIFGGLTLSAGMTLTAGANATTFAATSGTQQITTAAKTMDFPLTFDGIGGTFAFQDALTQGSTRAFTITNGTIQLKDGATSTVGAFATSGTNQKFLQSTLAGSQATISQASGTVNASYLTIQDINATGGATWNSFTTSNNVDGGNNNGWDFSTQLGRYIYTRRKNKRILP